MKNCVLALLTAGALFAGPARATEDPPALPTIELSATGTAAAPNDLATAQAFHEAAGNSPGTLAAEVNRVVEEALTRARRHPKVSVRSAGTQTFPVYSRNGRSIEAWRMRSSLQLESRDVGALSILLGELQDTLAVSSVTLAPAPETRRSAEDDALVKALHSFEARAKLAAGTLGKRYRIRGLNIESDSARPPGPQLYRAAMASAESAPAPMVAGESEVLVRVSGRVELLD